MQHLERALLIALIFLFSMLLSSVALAAGYATPTENPHGNYSSTTNKCKVCHAVHEAQSPYLLLRVPDGWTGEIDGACLYCHITSTISTKHPYGNSLDNYTTDVRWNHSNVGYAAIQNNYYDVYQSLGSVTTIRASCLSCHQVHGATELVWSVTSILKKDPSGLGRPAATDEDTFCTNCHNTGHGPNTSYNGVSHIQKMGGGTYGGSGTYRGVVAWSDSTLCRSCHQKGTGPKTWPESEMKSFPHFYGTGVGSTDTGNWQFLAGQAGADYVGYNATSNTGTPVMGGPCAARLDSVCLNCHYNSGVGGVGYTF